MTPQLIVALIRLAMELPSLAAEIKALAMKGGEVTHEQWEETAAILTRSGGTASYFNGGGSATPPPVEPAPPTPTPSGGNYETYFAVMPTDDMFPKGGDVYSITRANAQGAATVSYWVRPLGSNNLLPGNANLVRTIEASS